jgi:hypothetical protein
VVKVGKQIEKEKSTSKVDKKCFEIAYVQYLIAVEINLNSENPHLPYYFPFLQNLLSFF